jgi:dihydroorotate dehydrogenase
LRFEIVETLDIYQTGIRPLLFSGLKSDPEWLHRQILQFFSWLDQTSDRPPSSWLQTQLHQYFCTTEPRLSQTLWNRTFPNPVGLAAGFDKDGVAAGIWQHLGFGFAELGTVTFHPQPGNPRPRLFRLPDDLAALNRMGFNNQGSTALAEMFAHRQSQLNPADTSQGNWAAIPLGINLGKSKVTPLEEAVADYLGSFQILKDWGDYFVVNVSSPNTPGLRSLQAADQLSPILDALQQSNQGQKPLLVKISPDLDWEAVAEILAIAQTYQLAGIIATNTTISRTGLKTQFVAPTGKSVTEEAGGISGAPLRERSTEVIRFIYQQTQGKLPIIGVGGIFTVEDAWAKITAGASLIQVYTGWIYEGPWMVRRILEGLALKLAEQGLSNISEAVGINA